MDFAIEQLLNASQRQRNPKFQPQFQNPNQGQMNNRGPNQMNFPPMNQYQQSNPRPRPNYPPHNPNQQKSQLAPITKPYNKHIQNKPIQVFPTTQSNYHDYQPPRRGGNQRFPPPPPGQFKGQRRNQNEEEDDYQPPTNYRGRPQHQNYQQRDYEQGQQYVRRPYRDHGNFRPPQQNEYVPRNNNNNYQNYRGGRGREANNSPTPQIYSQYDKNISRGGRARIVGPTPQMYSQYDKNISRGGRARIVGPKPMQVRPQPKIIEKQEDSEEQQNSEQEQEQSISQSQQQDQQSGQSLENIQQDDQQQNEEQEQQQVQAQQQSIAEGDEENEEQQDVGSQQIKKIKSHTSNVQLGMQQIHTMCSKQQYDERLTTFDTNNRSLQGNMMRLDTGRSFAIFQINKKTMRPDYELALKRYRRSTNRAEDQDEKDEEIDLPRSKQGLMKTMKHIQKQIIDADNVQRKDLAFPFPPGQKRIQFLHIFDFLWNRMREMIKDVSRLNLKDKCSQNIIIMCQQMLRFFIIAIRQGKLPHNCRLQFDPKLNLESITKILTQLLQIYEENHMKLEKEGSSNVFISPNQPEIIGYAIIISHDIQKTLNEKLMIRLNGQGLNHPLQGASQIQNALKIKKALKNRDYETFYQILQDENTDYVMSCLLMHHLPIVRREALKTIHKSSETQRLSKNKKVPKIAIVQALRLKNQQYQEFQQVLIQDGAKVVMENGQTFLLLPEIDNQFSDNNLASTFIFDIDKQERSHFKLGPPTKRLRNRELISRQQLTKRSWFKSRYQQLCSIYYGHVSGQKIELSQEDQEQPLLIKPKFQQNRQQQNIQQPMASLANPPVDDKKINFLLLKKKQFERTKFLNNLSNLVQTLIRNSDIHSHHKRKKGLQTILQLTDLSRVLVLESAFSRIAQYVCSKIKAEQALKQLQEYNKIKEQFESFYNKDTFQYDKFQEQTSSVKMSTLLKQAKTKKRPNILKQLLNISKQNKTQGSKRIKVLYIFTTDKKDLSSLQLSFLTNLIYYLTLQDKQNRYHLQLKIKEFVQDSSQQILPFQKIISAGQLSITYDVTLFNFRGAAPFLSGYDGIVFIDLWKNIEPFNKLIKQLYQSKTKIYSNFMNSKPTFNLSIFCIHIGSCDGGLGTNMNDYYKSIASKNQVQWQSSWHRLQRQSIKLSPALKISLLNYQAALINKPQIIMPEFDIFSVSNLINQMEINLQCITDQQIKQQVSTLQFLEAYFNENLQCLRRGIKNTIQYYQTYDWKQILQEALYVKLDQRKHFTYEIPKGAFYNQQGMNLNSELLKKIAFSLELVSALKLNISSNFKLLTKGKSQQNLVYILCRLVESYIQGISKEDLQQYFNGLVGYVINNNCSLKFEGEQITGNCKDLMFFVFNQIKKKLKYINVILPKGFQFRVNKGNISKEGRKRTQQLAIKSLEQSTKLPVHNHNGILTTNLNQSPYNSNNQGENDKTQKTNKVEVQNKFIYKRQLQLLELVEEIKNLSNEKQEEKDSTVRLPQKKKIKI